MKKFLEIIFTPFRKNKIKKEEKKQAEKEAQWEKLKGIKGKGSGRLSRMGQRIKLVLHKHFPKRIWPMPRQDRKGPKF